MKNQVRNEEATLCHVCQAPLAEGEGFAVASWSRSFRCEECETKFQNERVLALLSLDREASVLLDLLPTLRKFGTVTSMQVGHLSYGAEVTQATVQVNKHRYLIQVDEQDEE